MAKIKDITRYFRCEHCNSHTHKGVYVTIDNIKFVLCDNCAARTMISAIAAKMRAKSNG